MSDFDRLTSLENAMAERRPADGETSLDHGVPEGEVRDVDAARNLEELLSVLRRVDRDPDLPAGPLDDETPPTLSERWAHLSILGRVSTAATETVYRAHDPRLGVDVVLRLLAAAAGPDEIKQFMDRGRRLAQIRHPNVLRCYGTDLADGRAGIWTALARGATLADLIREHGRFSEIRAAAIGRTLCHASAALLEAGIPHGDLTPNGVLVDGQGQPIVVDSTLLFGLSERVVASDDLTGPFGSCVAPEIQAGGPHTEASIVYSIGALVHYLTTGIYLDPDDDSPTASNSRGRLWALHAVEPRLSREFVGLLEHATAPRPSDRLHTLDALEHALLLASTRPVGADVAASKPKRRLAAWVAALTRFGRSTGSYRKETDDSD